MSSESDDDSDDVYRGTRMGRVRTNVAGAMAGGGFNGLGPGAGNARMDGLTTNIHRMSQEPRERMALGMNGTDEQPTIWDAVNYPRETEFEFETFYLRYIRQAEAKAIIDKPVNDTWQEMPTVHDEAFQEQDSPQSDFERKVAELFAGEHTRRKAIHRLNVVDRLARMGHYAVMVLGFADGRDMDTPVGGIDPTAAMSDEAMTEAKNDPSKQMPDDLTQPEFDDLSDLMYLAVFGEDRVIDMRTNSDMTSPRFRLPEEFVLKTEEDEQQDDPGGGGEADQETVHWTRVIHVPEGTLEDDLRGVPALKPIFHDLLNIDKIKAASGEGFWRAGYSGLHVRQPQDSQGRFMEFDDEGDVKQEIQEYLDNFDRMLTTPAEINDISNSIGNPMPHLQANFQSIAAATDIPKSILTGEDRADTSSEDDFAQYKSYIAQRRNNYAGPAIVEPLIQRLIDSGVLPEPEGDGFVIEWPPLEELSPMQEWERRSMIADTIHTLAPGGDTSLFANIGELRQAIGWGAEIGSELNQQQEARQPQGEQEQGESQPFPYPDELYETAGDAQARSKELGLDGEFHARRIEGGLRYVPGEDLQQLEKALSGQQSDGQSQQTASTELEPLPDSDALDDLRADGV